MCFHCSWVLGLETIYKKKGGREEGWGLQLQLAWSTNTLPRSHIAMEHPSFVDVIMSYWKRGNSFAVFVCFRVLYKKCDHWTVANSCKLHKLVVLNFSTHLRIVIQIGNHPIWTRGKDDRHLKPQSKYSISGLSSWCHRACCFFQGDLTVPNWAEKLKTPITTRRATVAPRKNHSASKFAKTC